MDSAKTELSPEMISEIERHKYFLSEKAGHDVGWEFAEQDWLDNFGPAPSNHLSEENGEVTRVDRKGIGGFFRRIMKVGA